MGMHRCHRAVFDLVIPNLKDVWLGLYSIFCFTTIIAFLRFQNLLAFVVFSIFCSFLRKYITSKATNKATNNIQVVAPLRELSQNITEETVTHTKPVKKIQQVVHTLLPLIVCNLRHLCQCLQAALENRTLPHCSLQPWG